MLSTKKRIKLQEPKDLSSKGYQLNVDTPNVIKAIGYGIDNEENPLRIMEFDRRAPEPKDVVIQILYCGVCHSDFHVLLNEWKGTYFPCIAGHEIIGTIIKTGKSAERFQLGDFVGLGPSYDSCKQCEYCNSEVQYCKNGATEVYNFKERAYEAEKRATGNQTYGGYSNVIVVHENYVIRLPKVNPDQLPRIAPLMCAGATVYSPLKYLLETKGVGAKVGIVGIGGLGHIAIKIANALGLEVIAFTKSKEKLEDSIDFGAEHAYWSCNTDLIKKENGNLDMVLSTVPFQHDYTPYINLLKMGGILCPIGNLFNQNFDLELINRKKIYLRGSILGSLAETEECVQLCVKENILPEIELINIQRLNGIHENLILGLIRYRYVIDMQSIYDDI